MSSLTRTDLPSKKSLSADSVCARAGPAAAITKLAVRRKARCELCMRQTIPLWAYLDQRFVQAGPFALGTLRHPRDLVLREDEATAPATRGLDADVLVGGLRRLEQVPQVVFHLVARELQLVRNGRHRPRLAEHFLDLLTHGHVPTIVRDMPVRIPRGQRPPKL